MLDEQKVVRAWVEVNRAREVFLSSQDAIIELSQMALLEVAQLDSDTYVAQKLCESLGKADTSAISSRIILDGVANFVEVTRAARVQNAKSFSSRQFEGALQPTPDGDERAKAEAEAEAEAEATFRTELTNLNNLLISEGIPSDAVFRAIRQYWKLRAPVRGRRVDLLLESLLISAVSQFETFVARLISESLRLSPQLLKESGRKFDFHEVAAHKDLAAFTEAAADDYADKLMREPMSKWLKFFGTSLRQECEWVDDYLNEILQRRHIHVHAGGFVSQQYIENTRNSGPLTIGTHLPVTAEYLRNAVDRLAVVVMSLSQASLYAIRQSKLATPIRDHFDDGSLSESMFELLLQGRPGAVADVSDRVATSLWSNLAREHTRVN
jgi:hypothetical protein